MVLKTDLCCFYLQKTGLSLISLQNALTHATNDDEKADVWYNIGLVATSAGQLILAKQAYSMALTASNDKHIQALNNLGVLEVKCGKSSQGVSRFIQAYEVVSTSDLDFYEPSFNAASCKYDSEDSTMVTQLLKHSLEKFPSNKKAQRLLLEMQEKGC